jgi:hypothetical protein
VKKMKEVLEKPTKSELRYREFYLTVKDLGTAELTYRYDQNNELVAEMVADIASLKDRLRKAAELEKIVLERQSIMADLLNLRR